MVQIYSFLACVIFMNRIVSIKCALPSGTGTDDEPFPKEKCEALLESCLCYGYNFFVRIVCNNVTDYSKFSSLLASDAIFHTEDTTYEITLNRLDYLPPESLKGLSISDLYLDDPNLSAIHKDAFQGARRLITFHVRRSSIKEIPVFRSIKSSIRRIKVHNSLLMALTGENLQDLYIVDMLSFVNNSIEYIDPNAFKGTDSVRTLDLSYNRLSSIPPGILDPMGKLQTLILSHNRLVQVDHLFAVTHPRFIDLDFNNISDVDSVLVSNMVNVETLVLGSNPIRNLSSSSFNGKIPRVKLLLLDHCELQDFDVTHFQSLSRLATLDLRYNIIEKISNQSINFGDSLTLNLIGNKIRSFKAEITYTVKRIYLDDNELHALGQTLQSSQAIEISIATNQLQYLSAEEFKEVHATTKLELQGNQVQWIDRLTFLVIRNSLHYLDLSANRITALNNSLQYLSQLESLKVSENKIQSFAEGEFAGLYQLSELYIQHNHIISLSEELHELPRLRYLVVTHNNIQTIRREQLPQNLEYIFLKDNPLNCDCGLFYLLQWLNSSDVQGTDTELCTPDAETKYKQKYDPCSETCSCTCTKDGDDYFMTVDCSSRNMEVLLSFLTGNFDQIDNASSTTSDFRRPLVFDWTTDSNFRITDRVRGINLRNNSLKSIDSAQFPVDLIHLYLDRNQLKTLPESMLYNLPQLRTVTLSGNPWECDCKAIAFKKWLISEMKIVQDGNDTRCGVKGNRASKLDGKAIWTLSDQDLCRSNTVIYISVPLGVLIFLILCLAIKIIYTKYQKNIKLRIYSHGFKGGNARDIEHDKEFDAFISFSDKDGRFVANELVSVIESKDPNIRLCTVYKHFGAGDYIHDGLSWAMQNSKRTVVIFSKNYLESEWRLMEPRLAQVRAVEDKAHRIIVIKVGDVPKDIDPVIKVFLHSAICLTWGEKYFWRNLLYVVPTSSSPRDADPEQKEVTMEHITSGPNCKPTEA